MKEYDIFNFSGDEGTQTLMNEILSSVPGIDEAMSFSQLIKYQFMLEKFNREDVIRGDSVRHCADGAYIEVFKLPQYIGEGVEQVVDFKGEVQQHLVQHGRRLRLIRPGGFEHQQHLHQDVANEGDLYKSQHADEGSSTNIINDRTKRHSLPYVFLSSCPCMRRRG